MPVFTPLGIVEIRQNRLSIELHYPFYPRPIFRRCADFRGAAEGSACKMYSFPQDRCTSNVKLNLRGARMTQHELKRQDLAVRPCPLEACTHNARASCTLPAHQVQIDANGTCWTFQPRGSGMIATRQPPAVPLYEEPEPGCILTILVSLRNLIGGMQIITVGLGFIVPFWEAVRFFIFLSIVQLVLMSLIYMVARSRKMV